ncbi:MAG: hypothetical protein AMXMBFR45_03790 [Gammaproteobacteria bacterium]|nr:MAG: hypothetical protein EDM71_09555 [Pseudomonadota bacterium]MBC6945159.1 hypothetical protein [Gammaproteobacteria bacterium]MCE7896300.1 hypothetical protein [Gammaproteobacteria bacterium PRO8]MDL1880769.1 hypothetical protein [Gammaproteobacteria bacterium PRO2]MCQ3934026.1 hypothetical protein [Gammaproteobacteria bacterium]
MTLPWTRIARYLSAALFAGGAISLLLFGFDGMVRGVQTLTRIYFAPRPATVAPDAAQPITPGVVSAFLVPPQEPAPAGTAAKKKEP